MVASKPPRRKIFLCALCGSSPRTLRFKIFQSLNRKPRKITRKVRETGKYSLAIFEAVPIEFRSQSRLLPNFPTLLEVRKSIIKTCDHHQHHPNPQSCAAPSARSFPSAVRGEGVYICDADGKRYLDLAGSAAVNFIGHGVPEISAAMAEQAAQLEFVHTSQFTTPVAEAYAEELLDFAGEHFRGGAVYFTSGGSESIETALKLARQYQVEIGQPKRYQILSRQQSYHGSTLGALSVSGNRSAARCTCPW